MWSINPLLVVNCGTDLYVLILDYEHNESLYFIACTGIDTDFTFNDIKYNFQQNIKENMFCVRVVIRLFGKQYQFEYTTGIGNCIYIFYCLIVFEGVYLIRIHHLVLQSFITDAQSSQMPEV
jgi:hypothetical protein